MAPTNDHTIHSLAERMAEIQEAINALVESNSEARLRAAIVGALREAANDPAVTRLIYDTLARHARTSLAQYIGERILTALAVLALSAALAWAWITQHVK